MLSCEGPQSPAQVRFIFIMPDDPAAASEKRHGSHLYVRENFREATQIKRFGLFQDSRCLLQPFARPFHIMRVALEVVPFRLVDVVGRIGKNEIDRLRVQTFQPRQGTPT